MFHKKSKIDIPPAEIALTMSESSFTKIMEKENKRTLKKVTKLIHTAIKYGQHCCYISIHDVGDTLFLKDYLSRLEYQCELTDILVPDDWGGHKESGMKIIWGDCEDDEPQETPEERLLNSEPIPAPIRKNGLGFVIDE